MRVRSPDGYEQRDQDDVAVDLGQSDVVLRRPGSRLRLSHQLRSDLPSFILVAMTMATSIPAYTLSWVSLRVPHVTRSWSQSSSLSCLVQACLPRMLVDLSHAGLGLGVPDRHGRAVPARPAVITARSGVPWASGPWPAYGLLLHQFSHFRASPAASPRV